MARTQSTVALLTCTAAVLAGCGEKVEQVPPAAPPGKIRLSSPAFSNGGTIPRRYTCDGEGATPPLRWSGVPASARELALFVDDPDAPAGPFAHWVVFGIRPGTPGLPAGTKPATLRKAQASSGKVGYEPPCPPEGSKPHRYRFTLYALKAPINQQDGAPADEVSKAIDRDAVASGTLVGRYGR